MQKFVVRKHRGAVDLRVSREGFATALDFVQVQRFGEKLLRRVFGGDGEIAFAAQERGNFLTNRTSRFALGCFDFHLKPLDGPTLI
ncbi:hypothetical protein [Burkholderia sp.]|uniref:hypothetical protein n=1 Tax=Burkholderia sp. TaxID=36773 RepID=UPI00258405FB|nr:hypothetical protein [Burkholderia sp.]MCA3793315.1 hypothetical protein [Burkholderia sp.]